MKILAVLAFAVLPHKAPQGYFSNNSWFAREKPQIEQSGSQSNSIEEQKEQNEQKDQLHQKNEKAEEKKLEDAFLVFSQYNLEDYSRIMRTKIKHDVLKASRLMARGLGSKTIIEKASISDTDHFIQGRRVGNWSLIVLTQGQQMSQSGFTELSGRLKTDIDRTVKFLNLGINDLYSDNLNFESQRCDNYLKYTDKLEAVQSKLDDVKEVMQNNIKQSLKNGESLEVLKEKADLLEESAKAFKDSAKQANRCCGPVRGWNIWGI